jgi:hypothetical protein
LYLLSEAVAGQPPISSASSCIVASFPSKIPVFEYSEDSALSLRYAIFVHVLSIDIREHVLPPWYSAFMVAAVDQLSQDA